MNNLTQLFTNPYHPIKSFIVYQQPEKADEFYVESFDFDGKGRMINAHPLSLNESRELGEILVHDEEQKEQCFQSSGLMPSNVLYVKPGQDGFAIWHTPTQKRNLYFINELGIKDDVYPVPPLLWMASRDKLKIYALKNGERPTADSLLFNAPFFNIHPDGLVCMGTVDIEISAYCDLEEFIDSWHTYFFNSKFSHLLGQRSPVKSNIVQVHQKLAGTKKQFPVTELLKTGKKLKQLLHGNI